MTIPAVMVLEMAIEQLKARAAEAPTWPPLIEGGPRTTTRERTIKEFRMLGRERLARFHAGVQLRGELVYSDVERGYLHGLEVARVLLATMPAAVQADVTI
jgi:hypothetical protein